MWLKDEAYYREEDGKREGGGKYFEWEDRGGALRPPASFTLPRHSATWFPMPKLTLTGDCLTIDSIAKFLDGEYAPVNVSKEARVAIRKGRAFVEKLLKRDKAVYGVNTGFGQNRTVGIDQAHLGAHPRHLICPLLTGVAATQA